MTVIACVIVSFCQQSYVLLGIETSKRLQGFALKKNDSSLVPDIPVQQTTGLLP